MYARSSILPALGLLLASGITFGDPGDWSTYNGDPTGSRHNTAETELSAASVTGLEENWRFPAKGAAETIGAVHATPAVVGGEVYFGTVTATGDVATRPAFYKLAADGTLAWQYVLPERKAVPGLDIDRGAGDGTDGEDESRPDEAGDDEHATRDAIRGIMSSALVTEEGVYFGDLGGVLYGLDRNTGRELWTIDTRADSFPHAHPSNLVFASPIDADGKVVFAGGAFEQWTAGDAGYRGCTGRGFVIAVDPRTGKRAWKYDVGPEPQPLDPPIVIEDSWGEHTFHFGPATSTIWCTPSYDAETGTLYFGTDTNNSPRQSTPDDDRIDTKYACAIVAISVADGTERWVTQINAGDVWHRGMRGYDPKRGKYLDQSIGDTPKIYTIVHKGQPTRVVGAGCKNGGFYVLRASDGARLANTPVYTGPPHPPYKLPKRMLAMPGVLGGLQTGIATDGRRVFTNGVDANGLGTQETELLSLLPPTAGRVVCISGDTQREHWRHERPKVGLLGDPVASGIAVANGVVYFTTTVSGKLVALDASDGRVIKEIAVGPVWSGPSVSRGHVYVGTGNLLFAGPDMPLSPFGYRPHGALISFGLPDERADTTKDE